MAGSPKKRARREALHAHTQRLAQRLPQAIPPPRDGAELERLMAELRAGTDDAMLAELAAEAQAEAERLAAELADDDVDVAALLAELDDDAPR